MHKWVERYNEDPPVEINLENFKQSYGNSHIQLPNKSRLFFFINYHKVTKKSSIDSKKESTLHFFLSALEVRNLYSVTIIFSVLRKFFHTVWMRNLFMVWHVLFVLWTSFACWLLFTNRQTIHNYIIYFTIYRSVRRAGLILCIL